MTFLWPAMLWLLLVVPLLIASYFLALRRKRKSVVRYASLTLVKEALNDRSQRKQHIPPALMVLALSLLIIASARPAATITLPFAVRTVILAIDTSISMRASDFKPSRLQAAQRASRNFVQQKPVGTRIGIVSFAGSASLLLPPTPDQGEILNTLDALHLAPRTAVGSGILVSLEAIFPELKFNLMASHPLRDEARALNQGSSDSLRLVKPSEPGSYTQAAIVLLSDGQTNTGPDPIEAAQIAAEHGVRIFTVGIGTVDGEVQVSDNYSFHASLDEDALKEIAKITRADYFYADTSDELAKIYNLLNAKVSGEKQQTEVTALICAIAAAFALLGGFFSILWFNRIF